jgi:hypothetical protein
MKQNVCSQLNTFPSQPKSESKLDTFGVFPQPSSGMMCLLIPSRLYPISYVVLTWPLKTYIMIHLYHTLTTMGGIHLVTNITLMPPPPHTIPQ